MTFGDACVTAYGIVLISHPYKDYDVKRCGAVTEELGHDGLHPCYSFK